MEHRGILYMYNLMTVCSIEPSKEGREYWLTSAIQAILGRPELCMDGYRCKGLSTTMANGFLCPHYMYNYGIFAVEGHPRSSMFSDVIEARRDSMQHGAASVRVQTKFSIL